MQPLSAEAAAVLVNALRSNVTLREFGLHSLHQLWVQGAAGEPGVGAAVCTGLAHHPTIETLEVTQDFGYPEYVDAMDAGLGGVVRANAPALTKLLVCSPYNTAAGQLSIALPRIFAALGHNSHLRELDVDAPLSTSSHFLYDTLLPGVRINTSLRVLRFRGNRDNVELNSVVKKAEALVAARAQQP